MAYSIHGNETSGADGALAAIHHLIASTDDDIKICLIIWSLSLIH